MKKKITLALAVVVVLAMALSSCGFGGAKGVSNINKILNDEYDISATAFKTDTTLPELMNYTVKDSNNDFVVFTMTDPSTAVITTKVLNLNTGKVIGTYSDTLLTINVELEYGAPVYRVIKLDLNSGEDSEGEQTPDIGDMVFPDLPDFDFDQSETDDDNYDGLQLDCALYDATGTLIVNTEYMPDSPKMLNKDYLVYDYVGYTVDKDGKLTKAADIPEYVWNGDLVSINDDYYYTYSSYINTYVVYDKSFNFVSSYSVPSYATDRNVSFIMENGDIFIQYFNVLAEDAEEYDVLITEDGENSKGDIVTLIINAKNGKAQEIDLDFAVEHGFSKTQLQWYDEEDVFSEKLENLILVYPIVDKKVDSNDANADLLLMNNNGKIKGSVKMIDGQIAEFPEKIAEDKYLVETVYGEAVINGKGKVLVQTNGDLMHNGAYFISDIAIYDLEMNKVYDLRANKAELESTIGDSVIVRKTTDTGYELIMFCGGNQTTIYTYTEGAENSMFVELYEIDCYIITNSTTNESKVYNFKGELITTAAGYSLRVVEANEDSALLVSIGSDDVIYHYYKVG